MKTLLNKCAVVVLTLTLAVAAYAGQIQFPGVVSGGDEPKSTSEATKTVSTTNDITTTVILTATSLIS